MDTGKLVKEWVVREGGKKGGRRKNHRRGEPKETKKPVGRGMPVRPG